MRNTDDDWISIGSNNPFYGVLTHEKYKTNNIDEDSLKDFWLSGVFHIDNVFKKLESLFGPFRPQSALDFGCGVGRLVRAMSSHSKHVTGVDVSEGMLAEARKDNLNNTSYHIEIPRTSYDWINSFIVFQHIPPEKGYELFEALLNVAGDDCRLSVHFTFFKEHAAISQHGLNTMELLTWDGEEVSSLARVTPPPGTMMMYDYDLSRLIAMLFKYGFMDISMDHVNHGGCHGVIIYSKKKQF